jgi:prephenate dehydrogenase
MAGSHERGVAHARADLFEGAACAVTAVAGSDAGAVQRIEDFWRALGARIVRRSPDQHDQDVAWTSHAPHALAFAFAYALGEAPERAGQLAGTGFRDFTRIARSDAELWGDILTGNRKALSAPLAACGRALAQLAAAIEAGDTDSIERFLETARQRLAALADARSGGDNPDPAASSRAIPHGKTQGSR